MEELLCDRVESVWDKVASLWHGQEGKEFVIAVQAAINQICLCRSRILNPVDLPSLAPELFVVIKVHASEPGFNRFRPVLCVEFTSVNEHIGFGTDKFLQLVLVVNHLVTV